MMRVIIAVVAFVASFLVGRPCLAQEGAALSFVETEWDFGSIREADGPVSHLFRFTNTSGAPIIVERVRSDCGCTTPRYSREPVRPGAAGTIEVAFDPANFRGRVVKSVSVFHNNGRNKGRGRLLLTVRADVVEKPRSTEDKYPFTLASGVRADRLHVPFGYLANASVNSMTVELVNASEKDVAIGVDEATGDGRLIVTAPGRLSPGEVATVTLTYDLRGAELLYGVISDQAYLSVDGRRSELPISVSAIVVDDFSAQDTSRAAGCTIAPAFWNFGTARLNEILAKEITISNTGRSPLIIRSVSARRGTSTSLKEGLTIAPGGSHVFTVSLDASAGYGVITGGATIIVNEPDHPMREVRMAAEVIDN